MSTTIDSNNSFEKKENYQQDFQVRTMQDDLLNPQISKETPAPPKEIEKNDKMPQNSVVQPLKIVPTPKVLERKESINNLPNPFNTTVEKIYSQQSKAESMPLEEVLTQETATQNKSFVFKLIIGLISFFAITLSGLGGYYFWLTQKNQTLVSNESMPAQENILPQEVVPEVIDPEKKIPSSENHLSLDLNTLTASSIKEGLIDFAEGKKTYSTENLHEFKVVDNDGNPILFSVFATAANFNFSSNILSSLNKDFSIFLYKDGENMRTGIVIFTLNTNLLKEELLTQEKTLASDLALLFLDSAPENISASSFNDGLYNNYKTRYFNLDNQASLSIDYALTENALIIGTSKNTLRALLDKNPKPTNSEVLDPVSVNNSTPETLEENINLQ